MRAFCAAAVFAALQLIVSPLPAAAAQCRLPNGVAEPAELSGAPGGPAIGSVMPAEGRPVERIDALTTSGGDWLRVRVEGNTGWVKGNRLVCRPAPDEARMLVEPAARRALNALKGRDMAALATLVHPVKGVRFSPYAFADAKVNVRFTAAQLRWALEEKRPRLWGSYDGSGKPIRLTFAAYYKRFVFDADFTGARQLRFNDAPATQGTTYDNSREEYPNGIAVEAHVPGNAPGREGSDYRGLRLVFEQHRGAWYLVHVIHDQWTI